MGIFISKLTIIWGAFQSGESLFGGVLLLLLAGVCIGLLYHGWQICFSQEARTGEEKTFPREAMAVIALSFAVVAALGVFLPEHLAAMLHQAVRVVMGG